MFFKKEEFNCKCGCGLNNIHDELINKLEEIRIAYNRPMVVTSGSRCTAYNSKVGGVLHSPHLNGWAADIQVTNSNQKYELVLTALTKGIRRIGVGDTFIHLDIAPLPDWSQDMLWTYGTNG